MWWIFGGIYVALSGLMVWFLYRTGSLPGGASDDGRDFKLPKSAKPRARHKLAVR